MSKDDPPRRLSDLFNDLRQLHKPFTQSLTRPASLMARLTISTEAVTKPVREFTKPLRELGEIVKDVVNPRLAPQKNEAEPVAPPPPPPSPSLTEKVNEQWQRMWKQPGRKPNRHIAESSVAGAGVIHVWLHKACIGEITEDEMDTVEGKVLVRLARGEFPEGNLTVSTELSIRATALASELGILLPETLDERSKAMRDLAGGVLECHRAMLAKWPLRSKTRPQRKGH